MSTKQVVSSLYRRSLKLALDWSVHRYLWRGQALYIRTLFDANKNIRDPRQQRARSCSAPNCFHDLIPESQALFSETETLLEKWKHPDPYRAPTAPGGWSHILGYKRLCFGDSADIAVYQDLNSSVIYHHQIWTGQGLV
ncbi:NADH dehydrogenase [ubiquinone] 1 beta subcomplex subunit [Lachnellula occidentalis]|uniref:NADH dehydrogenase [ubiquinone] 1 beta subcomplex subunit 9 n=1 Tax=Lachnellula occidentalis TaxID=215460 RepID=A0A8H8RYS2_9HELO|nr:NADH dehydrogenase [ubiquinone] 1 beta subcomplex subunit [Lachnellula occidentalis]